MNPFFTPSSSRRPSRRRAFTLIEVLIGTIIIALGVLGLAGLFAGSARQQQLSADTTRSITITQNAAAMCVVNFGNAETDPGVTGPTAGRWYPVPMHPTEGYLTVDPQQNGQRFFREITDQPLPAVLYSRDLTDLDPSHMGNPGFSNPASVQPPYDNNQMKSLSRRRVYGQSVQCNVNFVKANRQCGNIILGFGPDITVPFSEPLGNYAPPAGITLNANTIVLYPNGAVDPDDYIVLDTQNLPVDGTAFPQIIAMNFSRTQIQELIPCLPSGSESALVYDVGSIEFTTYDVKTDRLVSLNDRLFGSLDGAIDDSERPAMGYSLLYRETTGAVAQLLVATYALAAPSRTAKYRPPERDQDFGSRNPTLRRTSAAARLRFDAQTERFYVLVTALDAYLAEPGQLIVFEGGTVAGNFITGSDFAVRVIRSERQPNGDIRADLDREPIGGGAPMIINRNGTTALFAWGVNTEVLSLEDNTRWKLRPVEMRVFQAVGN